MKIATKRKLAFLLFILWLASTVVFVVVPAIYYARGGDDGYLAVSVFCGSVGIPVTLFFLGLWMKYRKLEDAIYMDVATFVKMYRRVPLTTVASKFKLSTDEAERIVLKAVEMKYLKAYIDRNTGEIVTPEGIKKAKTVNLHCPNCGATFSGVYLPGEVVECPYCGTKFKVIK